MPHVVTALYVPDQFNPTFAYKSLLGFLRLVFQMKAFQAASLKEQKLSFLLCKMLFISVSKFNSITVDFGLWAEMILQTNRFLPP